VTDDTDHADDNATEPLPLPTPSPPSTRSGFHYQGSFRSGAFDGQGTLTTPWGSAHSGGWAQGRRQGHGTYDCALTGAFRGAYRLLPWSRGGLLYIGNGGE
jgi:hypothetical protein